MAWRITEQELVATLSAYNAGGISGERIISLPDLDIFRGINYNDSTQLSLVYKMKPTLILALNG